MSAFTKACASAASAALPLVPGFARAKAPQWMSVSSILAPAGTVAGPLSGAGLPLATPPMTARTAPADPGVQAPRFGSGLSDFPVTPDPVGAIPPMAPVTTPFSRLRSDITASESSDGIPAERGSIRNPVAGPTASFLDRRPGSGRARATPDRRVRASFSSSLARSCKDGAWQDLPSLDGKRSKVTPLWVRHASAPAGAPDVAARPGGLSIVALRRDSPTADVTGEAQGARAATARAAKPL